MSTTQSMTRKQMAAWFREDVSRWEVLSPEAKQLFADCSPFQSESVRPERVRRINIRDFYQEICESLKSDLSIANVKETAQRYRMSTGRVRAIAEKWGGLTFPNVRKRGIFAKYKDAVLILADGSLTTREIADRLSLPITQIHSIVKSLNKRGLAASLKQAGANGRERRRLIDARRTERLNRIREIVESTETVADIAVRLGLSPQYVNSLRIKNGWPVADSKRDAAIVKQYLARVSYREMAEQFELPESGIRTVIRRMLPEKLWKRGK